jgi:phospholipid/cholesterol/gamma-HCH transport system substrate-binding protein
MKTKVGPALWRLGIFIVACSLCIFMLLAIFAQLRFQNDVLYSAEFSNIGGLKKGNFVRIAGVEVGKVKNITLKPNATVLVQFSTDDSVTLTRNTRAAIRYQDLVGGRFLQLEDGAGPVTRLEPGHTIPLNQTVPPLDLDALIGGFRPLFRALNPEQVNALSGQLISAFQGEGGTIGSFLTQVATLTGTLADRDDLIGQVIVNLNTVLGSFGGQSKQLDTAVDSVSKLISALADRKVDISNAVAYGNAAVATTADLLERGRPPLQNTVHQTDRMASTVLADKDYFDNLLVTLPDVYKLLGRQGIYGDFYTFYSCEILLKVNGKGGQPVYVQVSRQSGGRCAPK